MFFTPCRKTQQSTKRKHHDVSPSSSSAIDNRGMFGVVGDYYDDDVDEDDGLSEYLDDNTGEKDQLFSGNLSSGAMKDLLTSYSTMTNKTNHVGEPMNENLAKWLNVWWRQNYSPQDAKKLSEMVERPENCDALLPVRINAEVYFDLAKKTLKMDACTKYIEAMLCKGAQPLAEVWNEAVVKECAIKDVKKTKEDVMATLEDGTYINLSKWREAIQTSLRLLGFVNFELIQRRKLGLKKFLHRDYQKLTGLTNEVTNFLFGNNLEQKLNSIFKCSKVTKRITPGFSTGFPTRGRGWGKKSQAFLDRRPAQQKQGDKPVQPLMGQEYQPVRQNKFPPKQQGQNKPRK